MFQRLAEDQRGNAVGLAIVSESRRDDGRSSWFGVRGRSGEPLLGRVAASKGASIGADWLKAVTRRNN